MESHHNGRGKRVQSLSISIYHRAAAVIKASLNYCLQKQRIEAAVFKYGYRKCGSSYYKSYTFVHTVVLLFNIIYITIIFYNYYFLPQFRVYSYIVTLDIHYSLYSISG